MQRKASSFPFMQMMESAISDKETRKRFPKIYDLYFIQ